MGAMTGKTVVITGASRGIGAAAARRMAAEGANVVLAARSVAAISGIAGEIGATAMAVPCDVASYADVASMLAETMGRFGRVDVLINNAGVIEPISALADSDPDAWAAAADINFKGVYNGIRAATDVMGEGGVIINISSGAATNPLDGWSHYCASKAAALMLTRCGDKELAERGIRVVGLSPGTVATEMQVSIKASGINPVSKLEMSDHISPEAVANALLWLATEGYASYAGGDFSLRTPEGRAAAGLPPV